MSPILWHDYAEQRIRNRRRIDWRIVASSVCVFIGTAAVVCLLIANC